MVMLDIHLPYPKNRRQAAKTRYLIYRYLSACYCCSAWRYIFSYSVLHSPEEISRFVLI